jgi:hypothetical protein
MAGMLDRLIARTTGWINAAAKSGLLVTAFNNAVGVIRNLMTIFGNLGATATAVFRAATGGTNDLLGHLVIITGQMRNFVNSAKGAQFIANLFQTMGVFGDALRKSLSGVLPQIASALQIAAPVAGQLATQLSRILIAVAPLLPALAGVGAQLARVLIPAMSALAGFLERNQGLVQGLAPYIVALAGGVKILAGATAAYNFITKVSAGITLAWGIATGTAGGAAAGASVGVRLLGGAIRFMMGPIGIVITAIGLLAGALVYLFNHNKTFHDAVIAAWHGIQDAISGVAKWITGTVWPSLQRAWQQIADGASWLWHNIFVPAWRGIQAAVSVAVDVVRAIIDGAVATFRGIATVATWLWKNIFGPVFAGIRKIVEIWWLAVEIIFKALSNIIGGLVRGAINLLRSIWDAAFKFAQGVISTWWGRVKAAFDLFRNYVIGPVQGALTTLRNFFSRIFGAIATTVSQWWTAHLSPVFAAVRGAWNTLAGAFSSIYNGRIKPVFSAFVGFITKTVVGGFQAGVNAIKAAWDKVQTYARKPVEFVVNHVINPFINGMNAAAKVVGVKDHVDPIKFADGGLVPNSVPGYASGGRIAGAPSSTDNRLAPATIPGVGAVKLAGGEFVVNAADTMKALPLLRWVNDGMKGGPRKAAEYIGRRPADMPGDGSEGFAFASGGLVGWAKDVWGAISDPISTLKKPFESLLGQIPGGGLIKNFLVGSAKKLLGGAVSWLKSFAGSGGGSWNGVIAPGAVGKAQKFVQAQNGKPYGWANAGPNSYDCSGIVSAAYNVLHGKNPYSHTFGTASLPGRWFDTSKKVGPLVGAWSHPGQRPASSSTGHMMGSIGGMTFESTGSKGVHIGGTTRRITDFHNIGVARANGGLVEPMRLMDRGGRWPSGTAAVNLSGNTEHVLTGGPHGDIAEMISLLRVIADRLGLLGGELADALERPTRRAVQLGRSRGVVVGRATT